MASATAGQLNRRVRGHDRRHRVAPDGERRRASQPEPTRALRCHRAGPAAHTDRPADHLRDGSGAADHQRGGARHRLDGREREAFVERRNARDRRGAEQRASSASSRPVRVCTISPMANSSINFCVGPPGRTSTPVRSSTVAFGPQLATASSRCRTPLRATSALAMATIRPEPAAWAAARTRWCRRPVARR